MANKPIFDLKQSLFDLIDTLDKVTTQVDRTLKIIEYAEQFAASVAAGVQNLQDATEIQEQEILGENQHVEEERNKNQEREGSYPRDSSRDTLDLRGSSWDILARGYGTEDQEEEKEELSEEEAFEADTSEPQREAIGTTRSPSETRRSRRGPGSGHVSTRRR
jgi:vacuolar-type H+-ATPase subunit I/STV1